MAKGKRMPSALKTALEELLRNRRLHEEAPPLRGEDRRLSPLPTGLPDVDALLGGGFPRGQVSEVHGPASSGRTGLVQALVAGSTRRGALAAWMDPRDRLDPISAAAAGVDLSRLLWLRGPARGLPAALSAVGTLVDSGLFELVVLDVAGIAAAELQRLPLATWIRLQRAVEETPTSLVLLADRHTAHGPGGASLALSPTGARWSGRPGPGRLLRALGASARAGRHGLRSASFELSAFA
jgi:hypothetical protein